MFSRVLRNFLKVVDMGSITAAADALNISQPALTKSIQKLENDLGTKLFTRISKGVQLNKAGEILEHHARVMENEYRHAITRIGELSGAEHDRLRIGATPNWLVRILPSVFAEFQKTYPDIRMILVGGVIDTLIPALVSGDLDLICISLDFPDRSELTKIPLFKMDHIIVSDASHPLASQGNVSATDLAPQRWLALKDDFVGTHRISAFFATFGLKPPKISLETTSINSLLETLRDENYVAPIPDQMLELAQQKSLVKIDFNGTLWQSNAGLAIRIFTKPSSALTGFMECVKSATAKYSER